ncbi:type II toxin-antitoxin system VapC family toxin [Gammaproteobacteria bacterium]|nr:type II toxin-antitoxin system VapC family toxin [Gammaproteobacteria bacterium]
MVILLASDVCRYIIKQQPKGLLQSLQGWSAQGDELMLSAITYAELIAGALLTENREKHIKLVQEFCERLDDIVSWDSGAVNCYTDIQMQAMAAGAVLNMNDAMLAAHAISLNAELLTLAKSSFAGMGSLELRIWEQTR